MPLDSDARRLSSSGKAIYSLGDHTVNIVISAVSLLYLKFLIDHGGLSPYLAGLVIWIARIVDAFTDPGMGRLSDMTRWRAGRRRPYFLIGALPFGCFFALMWWSVPLASESARFVYYALVFVGVSLSMTCLSVPYLALLPEMATDYDERTSLNTYRSIAAVLGTLAAVGMKSVVDALGGDASAWNQTAILTAVWLTAPWFAVHAVSFERPLESSGSSPGFFDAVRALATHRTYQVLMTLYILARIAVDLIGAMLLFYFAYLIGREADFAPTLALFLVIVILSLPVWLAVAKKRDKRTLFIAGSAWWALIQVTLFFGDSGWPRWVLFTVPPLAAIGYAVAEMMPWAMLGDVIDEDELETGERREGMYVGFFTFLRKIGGATAVLLMAFALELSGFEGGLDRFEQSETALFSIRVMTSLVPMAVLLLAIAVAARYPLTRAAHAKTVAELARRRSERRDARSADGIER